MLVLVLLLAGCLGSAKPDGVAEPPSPPVSGDACGLGFSSPVMLGDAGPLALASEPSIAFGPDGLIVVSSIWIPAYLLPILLAGQGTGVATHLAPAPSVEPGGQNAVWVSTDGQRFEARHDALGRVSLEGHQGNQDADVAVGADGSIHIALFGPSGIEVLTSRDLGVTWTPSGLVSPQGVDRQWIQQGPRGELFVSWRNVGTIAGIGGSGDGVGFAVSLDDGATWARNGSMHPADFAEGPFGVVGDRTVQAIRGGDATYLRATSDGGASWHDFGGASPVPAAPGFVVPSSTAARDALLAWTQQESDGTARIHVSTLSKGGWSPPEAVSPEGHNAVFPWPVLRPDGSIAIFSYQSDRPGDPTDGKRTWDMAFDLYCPSQDAWTHGSVAEGVHHGAMCLRGAQCPLLNVDADGNDRSVGEIFEAGVSSTGQTWVTWTATTDGPVRSNQIWIAGEAEGVASAVKVA